ncbi:MAG: hypothetical protein K2J28_02775, partial [Duncaniella sp.]|nr:hypothetical protein [Duncaniella sp.]
GNTKNHLISVYYDNIFRGKYHLHFDGNFRGIENVSIKDYAVKNVTGGIEVNCQVSTKVHIINLNGTIVHETIGSGYIDLPIGLYIVTFNGSRAQKIIIK